MVRIISDSRSRLAPLAISIVALTVAACQQPPQSGAATPAVAASVQTSSAAPTSQPAPVAAPLPTTPQTVYSLARVTPVIPANSDTGWFTRGGGSPRDVGAFVGSAVIEGLSAEFTGARPMALELVIRRFRPVTETDAALSGGTHLVEAEFNLRDDATGESLSEATLNMDILAIGGVAGQIARNAGRTPMVRIRERIVAVASVWAAGVTCVDLPCPTQIVAPTPEPAPAPQPQAAPAQAGSPFFRSPDSEPPVLPQTALLGRQ